MNKKHRTYKGTHAQYIAQGRRRTGQFEQRNTPATGRNRSPAGPRQHRTALLFASLLMMSAVCSGASTTARPGEREEPRRRLTGPGMKLATNQTLSQQPMATNQTTCLATAPPFFTTPVMTARANPQTTQATKNAPKVSVTTNERARIQNLIRTKNYPEALLRAWDVELPSNDPLFLQLNAPFQSTIVQQALIDQIMLRLSAQESSPLTRKDRSHLLDLIQRVRLQFDIPDFAHETMGTLFIYDVISSEKPHEMVIRYLKAGVITPETILTHAENYIDSPCNPLGFVIIKRFADCIEPMARFGFSPSSPSTYPQLQIDLNPPPWDSKYGITMGKLIVNGAFLSAKSGFSYSSSKLNNPITTMVSRTNILVGGLKYAISLGIPLELTDPLPGYVKEFLISRRATYGTAYDDVAGRLKNPLGEYINTVDEYGKPPLWYAIEADNEPAVTELIAAGAHLNARLPEGNTILEYTLISGKMRFFFKLLSHPDALLTQLNFNIPSLLHIALRNIDHVGFDNYFVLLKTMRRRMSPLALSRILVHLFSYDEHFTAPASLMEIFASTHTPRLVKIKQEMNAIVAQGLPTARTRTHRPSHYAHFITALGAMTITGSVLKLFTARLEAIMPGDYLEEMTQLFEMANAFEADHPEKIKASMQRYVRQEFIAKDTTLEDELSNPMNRARFKREFVKGYTAFLENSNVPLERLKIVLHPIVSTHPTLLIVHIYEEEVGWKQQIDLTKINFCHARVGSVTYFFEQEKNSLELILQCISERLPGLIYKRITENDLDLLEVYDESLYAIDEDHGYAQFSHELCRIISESPYSYNYKSMATATEIAKTVNRIERMVYQITTSFNIKKIEDLKKDMAQLLKRYDEMKTRSEKLTQHNEKRSGDASRVESRLADIDRFIKLINTTINCYNASKLLEDTERMTRATQEKKNIVDKGSLEKLNSTHTKLEAFYKGVEVQYTELTHIEELVEKIAKAFAFIDGKLRDAKIVFCNGISSVEPAQQLVLASEPPSNVSDLAEEIVRLLGELPNIPEAKNTETPPPEEPSNIPEAKNTETSPAVKNMGLVGILPFGDIQPEKTLDFHVFYTELDHVLSRVEQEGNFGAYAFNYLMIHGYRMTTLLHQEKQHIIFCSQLRHAHPALMALTPDHRLDLARPFILTQQFRGQLDALGVRAHTLQKTKLFSDYKHFFETSHAMYSEEELKELLYDTYSELHSVLISRGNLDDPLIKYPIKYLIIRIRDLYYMALEKCSFIGKREGAPREHIAANGIIFAGLLNEACFQKKQSNLAKRFFKGSLDVVEKLDHIRRRGNYLAHPEGVNHDNVEGMQRFAELPPLEFEELPHLMHIMNELPPERLQECMAGVAVVLASGACK